MHNWVRGGINVLFHMFAGNGEKLEIKADATQGKRNLVDRGDNDDKLFLWNCWTTKDFNACFQSDPLVETLTIANLWYTASSNRTCAEAEFS